MGSSGFHVVSVRSFSPSSKMARATGAGSGNRLGRGTVLFWQFMRPLRTLATKGPRATGGRAWSYRNLLITERYGVKLVADAVPRSPNQAM